MHSKNKKTCTNFSPPLLKYYQEKYNENLALYPNAALISDGSIALPVGPHLTTDDMDIISEKLQQILQTL